MALTTKQEQRLVKAYNSYADMLYRLALTHTANREDAEDACQEVFIKYSHSDISIESAEHEKAWLVRVLINYCRDLIRKRKIRTHLSIEEIEEIISDTDMSDSYAELVQAVEQLPVKYREVIILHYLEGYSTEECSDILSVSVSGVKMRLMRGRDMLKDKLIKEGYNA